MPPTIITITTTTINTISITNNTIRQPPGCLICFRGYGTL
jgi:hypothetical protein